MGRLFDFAVKRDRESLLVIELKAHGLVWRWGLAFLMFRCFFTGRDLCLPAALHCHDFVAPHILLTWRFPWYIVYSFSSSTRLVERKAQKSSANAVFPFACAPAISPFRWLSDTWFQYWELPTKFITTFHHGQCRGPCRLLFMRMVHVRVPKPLCISLILSHIWRAWHGWHRRPIPDYFFWLEGHQELLSVLQKSTSLQFDGAEILLFVCLPCQHISPRLEKFFLSPKYICILLLEPIPPLQRKLGVVYLLFKITTDWDGAMGH